MDVHIEADLLPPGHWYACERPEARLTAESHVHEECRACVLAIGAAALSGQRHVYGTDVKNGRRDALPDLYAEFREEHGLPPLPES